MKPTLQELEKFEATPEEVELEGKKFTSTILHIPECTIPLIIMASYTYFLGYRPFLIIFFL